MITRVHQCEGDINNQHSKSDQMDCQLRDPGSTKWEDLGPSDIFPLIIHFSKRIGCFMKPHQYFLTRWTRRIVNWGTRVHQWEGASETQVHNISLKPTVKVNFYHEDGGVKTSSQGLLIKLIVRLVWRVVNHLGEDLTEEVVQETNQEDSWTPDGQVWRWSWRRRWCWWWSLREAPGTSGFFKCFF